MLSGVVTDFTWEKARRAAARVFDCSRRCPEPVTRFIANSPPREIAGRSPHAVRGAKKLINHLSNDRAKEHFALEREIIFKLIGSPNQVEAITANFEKREPRFGDVG